MLLASSGTSPVTSDRQTLDVLLIDPELLLSDSLSCDQGEPTSVRFRWTTTHADEGLSLLKRVQPPILLITGDVFVDHFRVFGDDLSIRLGQTRLCLFADRISDARLAHALTTRLSGLFSKRCTREELVEGLNEVAAGQFHVAGALRHRVAWSPSARVPHVPSRERLSTLTDRQLEVLVHLATGDSVREIAAKMHLSEKAVESHKFRIMNRLEIGNRVQLCRWAIREGLITP